MYSGFSDFVLPFHTPFVLLLVCILLSYFFEEKQRKNVFFALLFGSYLHIFLDISQRHVFDEYFLLFPFSWKTYEFGMLWAESWFYILPFLILLVTLNEIRKHLYLRQKEV